MRPSVDIVIPFAGPVPGLSALFERAAVLDLGQRDTVTVVDNRPQSAACGPAPPSGIRVVRAADRQSSYHARNRGAEGGGGEWLLFIDADVDAPPDLAASYFSDLPGDDVGVLAGSVVDEPLEGGRQPAAARYAMLRAAMSQENTLLDGDFAYAQTANCAVRRAAFDHVGGFRGDVRSGGDADLCFRVHAAGWRIEPRDGAAVVHRSRRTLRKLLRQRARHGSGAQWLGREYPGFAPRGSWPGLAKWTLASFGRAGVARARGNDDDALIAAVEPLSVWAFELGRLFPNEVRSRS